MSRRLSSECVLGAGRLGAALLVAHMAQVGGSLELEKLSHSATFKWCGRGYKEGREL